MSVQTNHYTATVVAILSGLLGVLSEMTWQDDPIDLDEVFRIVADGLRVDPGAGVVHAKAALDAVALYHAADDKPVVDLYLQGQTGPLYRRVLFHQGIAGLVAMVEQAIDLQQTQALQPPLWRLS